MFLVRCLSMLLCCVRGRVVSVGMEAAPSQHTVCCHLTWMTSSTPIFQPFRRVPCFALPHYTPHMRLSLFIRQLHIYPGSGYVADLPLNYTLARQQVRHLREALWLDEGTRGLFMDFQMYNVYLNYHVLGMLVCLKLIWMRGCVDDVLRRVGCLPIADRSTLLPSCWQGTLSSALTLYTRACISYI